MKPNCNVRLHRRAVTPLLTAFLTAMGLMTVVVGCGDGLPTMQEMNSTNIRRTHSAYKIFMNANSLKGPQDKGELLTFLKNDLTAKVLIERMGIEADKLEDIFISERDGQEFKIRYGLAGIQDHAIVFEAEGVDGKRFVAFARPRELDSNEYDGFWSGELKGAMPRIRGGGDDQAGID